MREDGRKAKTIYDEFCVSPYKQLYNLSIKSKSKFSIKKNAKPSSPRSRARSLKD